MTTDVTSWAPCTLQCLCHVDFALPDAMPKRATLQRSPALVGGPDTAEISNLSRIEDCAAELFTASLSRVELRFDYLAMLYLVGLGLADETDITVKGLEIVKKAERVYLEAYTSILLVEKEKLVRTLASKSLLVC